MNALDNSANTDRWTLYFLNDERFTKTKYQTSANLWKINAEHARNVSKGLKARQMCVDDDENAISKKPPSLIAQDTQ